MSGLSDIRYMARLSAEEADTESDLIPVYHPSGGYATERAVSLDDLKAAGGGGSGANTFFYKADTKYISHSDPGTGKLRWNTEDQHAADWLYIDWLTTDGFDPVLMFLTYAVGDTFIIQEAGFSVNHQIWRKTGPGENMPDWFKVPVEFVSSGGAGVFKNNAAIAILLQISASFRMPGLPTSAKGLLPGSLWNNKGVLHIVC